VRAAASARGGCCVAALVREDDDDAQPAIALAARMIVAQAVLSRRPRLRVFDELDTDLSPAAAPRG
jgi:hypothetical protein